MNKHLSEIRRIVLDYRNQLESHKDTLGKLDKQLKQGEISKNYYDAKKVDIEANKTSHSKYYTDLEKVAEEYHEKLNQWMELKGEDLGEDLRLFESPIKLTPDEYAALEEKYQTNYSMLRAIKEHASANNVYYSQIYSIVKEEKIQAMNEVIEPAKNIITTLKDGSSSYLAEVWSFEEKFKGMYQDVARIAQIG